MSRLESITPASAIWNNRQKILESRDRILSLLKAVDEPSHLSLHQWVQLLAFTLEFQPDLILELGRHKGNSTCVFTQAANHLQSCRVISLCRSPYWEEITQHHIAQVVPPEWFQPLEAKQIDILTTDVEALLEGSQRVVLFWDAHGYDIAEFVLGYVMPLLRSRQHIVIMHDISDMRYCSGQEDYNGQPLWRQGNDNGAGDHNVRLVLGNLNSAVEQVISIVDFTSRNKLTLHSADESFHTQLNEHQLNELQQQLGDELFSKNGHWFWFSLNEKAEQETIYFPKFIPSSKPDSSTEPALESPPLPTQTELEHLRTQTEYLQGVIRAMESSKFWKLRTAWFKLKRTMGLGKED